MEGLIIRDSREEELDEVLRLWLQMVQFHTDLDPRLEMRTDSVALESMRTYLRTALEGADSRLLVAEVVGVEGLIGYLLAHIRANPPIALPPTYGFISDVCVDERFRRQGVGRQLFQAAREWFHERGQTLIRLNVAVANPASQSFWRSVGATEHMLLMGIEIA